jgi:hypothetical protein
MSNAIFTVNGSKIFEGPGRVFYNWFTPGTGGQTIVDGSTPPQLVPPSSIPTFIASHAYNQDDEFEDSNNNMQRVISPGTSAASAPVWSTALFGLSVDSAGVTYMNLGAIGLPLGASEGAMVVDVQDDTQDIMADQYRAPLQRVSSDIKASITVDLMQSELDFMARSLAAAQYTTGTNTSFVAGAQSYEMITGGGLNSPLVPKVCVVAVMQQPGWVSPSKSHIVTLYGASVGKQALQWQAQLKKHSTYKVKFEGMTIASRADYDQVYQWVHQI